MLPNFLIVGAMKSGTSTLMHYMRFHPDIFMPENEVHFFNKDKNYNRGIAWYEKFFTNAKEAKAIGEKTPTYSYSSKVPGRIAKDLPEVQLIWVFRNPVKRAYSNYWHAVKRGGERLQFPEAIEHEQERVKKRIWLGYLKRSKYIEQVKRYLEYFEMSQMHFLLFEDLVNNPGETVNQVFRFLEVKNPIELPSYNIKKNVTKLPRIVLLQWLARRMFDDTFLYKLVEKANIKKVPGYPKIDKDIERKLCEYFKPYNEELAKLTGLDVDVWHQER